MDIIWYTILIRAIPEALGEVLVTLAVIGEKSSKKKIILTSILCGMTAFTLRMLPLKFGISTLLSIVFQVFIMNFILGIKIQKLFKGILISLMLIALYEILFVAFIQYILHKDIKTIYSTGLGTLLAGLPSLIMLYLSAYIIDKFNKNKQLVRK